MQEHANCALVYACMTCAMVWDLQQVEYNVNLELSGHSAASSVEGRLDVLIVPQMLAPRHDHKLRPFRRAISIMPPTSTQFHSIGSCRQLDGSGDSERPWVMCSIGGNHSCLAGLVPCFSKCHIVDSS